MFRLYFWFLGVDENRPGGPWWFKDLPHWVAVDLFLIDIKPFLYAYSIVPEEKIDKNELYIKPPGGVEIIYPHTSEPWKKC